MISTARIVSRPVRGSVLGLALVVFSSVDLIPQDGAVAQSAVGQSPVAQSPTITIDAKRTNVKLGETVFLDIHLRYAEPQLGLTDGKPLSRVISRGWRVEVQGENGIAEYALPAPLEFTLEDSQGYMYSTRYALLCEFRKIKGELGHKVIFNKPGAYLVRVMLSEEQSNWLEVKVAASKPAEVAMSILKDPQDYAFLLEGLFANDASRSRLQEIVEKCEGTELAYLAAARLGLDCWEEFQKENPSLEKFKQKHADSPSKGARFDKVNKYLVLGLKLPDEYTIRERVLYESSRVEFVNGDTGKAITYLEELKGKYPKGRFGKKAEECRSELVKPRQ